MSSNSPFSEGGFQLPVLLPAELSYCTAAHSEEILLAMLIKKPGHLVIFFERAGSDVTWSQENRSFMRKAIAWLTLQAFKETIPYELVVRAGKVIQSHYSILGDDVSQNLLFKLKDTDAEGSSLLFAAASPHLRELIRRECRDKNKMTLSFPRIPYSAFLPIKEFINTGEVAGLGLKSQDEVLEILLAASQLELTDLVRLGEDALRKFIADKNVMELLKLAQKEKWDQLRQACLNFFNLVQEGYRLNTFGENQFSFEFFNFSDKTLEFFYMVKDQVEEIVCGGSLIEDKVFGDLLKNCPRMTSLNISGTRFFAASLLAIPKDLKILNVSQCPWFDYLAIRKLAELCPYLHELILESNIQINAIIWGELQRFQNLQALDAARCHQISDHDLVIILKACPALRDLSLEECRKLTERGFGDISRYANRIVRLNIARTSISDAALIDIASHCRHLIELDLTRCANVTEKGIRALVKQASALRTLQFSREKLSQKVIEELTRFKPSLIMKY